MTHRRPKNSAACAISFAPAEAAPWERAPASAVFFFVGVKIAHQQLGMQRSGAERVDADVLAARVRPPIHATWLARPLCWRCMQICGRGGRPIFATNEAVFDDRSAPRPAVARECRTCSRENTPVRLIARVRSQTESAVSTAPGIIRVHDAPPLLNSTSSFPKRSSAARIICSQSSADENIRVDEDRLSAGLFDLSGRLPAAVVIDVDHKQPSPPRRQNNRARLPADSPRQPP